MNPDIIKTFLFYSIAYINDGFIFRMNPSYTSLCGHGRLQRRHHTAEYQPSCRTLANLLKLKS